MKMNDSKALPDIELYQSEKQNMHPHATDQVHMYLNCEVVPSSTIFYKGLSGDTVDAKGYAPARESTHLNILSHHTGFFSGRDEASLYAVPSKKTGTLGVFLVVTTTRSLHLVDVGNLHNINTIIELIKTITLEKLVRDTRYRYLWTMIWDDQFHIHNLPKYMHDETFSECVCAIFFEQDIYNKLTRTDFGICTITGRRWKDRREMYAFFNLGDSDIQKQNNHYMKMRNSVGKYIQDPNLLTNFVILNALQHHYYCALPRDVEKEMRNNEARHHVVDMYINTFFVYNQEESTYAAQKIIVEYTHKKISMKMTYFAKLVLYCFANSSLCTDELCATCIHRFSEIEQDNYVVSLFERFIHMFFPSVDGWIYHSDCDSEKYRSPPEHERYATVFRSEVLLFRTTIQSKLSMLRKEKNHPVVRQ